MHINTDSLFNTFEGIAIIPPYIYSLHLHCEFV